MTGPREPGKVPSRIVYIICVRPKPSRELTTTIVPINRRCDPIDGDTTSLQPSSTKTAASTPITEYSGSIETVHKYKQIIAVSSQTSQTSPESKRATTGAALHAHAPARRQNTTSDKTLHGLAPWFWSLARSDSGHRGAQGARRACATLPCLWGNLVCRAWPGWVRLAKLGIALECAGATVGRSRLQPHHPAGPCRTRLLLVISNFFLRRCTCGSRDEMRLG